MQVNGCWPVLLKNKMHDSYESGRNPYVNHQGFFNFWRGLITKAENDENKSLPSDNKEKQIQKEVTIQIHSEFICNHIRTN